MQYKEWAGIWQRAVENSVAARLGITAVIWALLRMLHVMTARGLLRAGWLQGEERRDGAIVDYRLCSETWIWACCILLTWARQDSRARLVCPLLRMMCQG